MQSLFETVQYPQIFSFSNATITLSQSLNTLFSISFANDLPALHEQFSAYFFNLFHKSSDDVIFFISIEFSLSCLANVLIHSFITRTSFKHQSIIKLWCLNILYF